MFTTKFVRRLGSIAALSILLALAACGGGSSAHTFLQVSGPAITTQPVGPEIAKGGTATLTVVASGSGTLSYQWYQGPTGTTTNAISGATSSSYTTPALTATTSYWVQVSDPNGSASSNTAVVLIAGPRQVQALLFPVLTSSSNIFASFMANVLPNISGVSVSMQWNQIESSNAAGTDSGGYDFSSFDASVAPYLAAHRNVNLIVWPATEGGNNAPNSGGSTPTYVFSSAYAAKVGASNPQDMTVCQNYQGDSGSPYGKAAFTSGGIWNSSDPTYGSDLSGLPVSYELPFMTAYKNFIQAVIAHYNGNTTTAIGYIRFGFSQGGENSPECNQFWPDNFSQTTYVTDYITPMTQWVKAQNPQMTILEDLHALGTQTDTGYTSYPDQEAVTAVANGEGFGTNGLQKSDVTSVNNGDVPPCDSDWCFLFQKYAGTTYGSTPITLSLQTLQWSDPTGAAQTGSLATANGVEGIVPLAKANGANNLELYLADVGLAFDSANYPSYPHASASVNAASFSSSYAAAIQDFLSSNP
jgi:hypothetical protein